VWAGGLLPPEHATSCTGSLLTGLRESGDRHQAAGEEVGRDEEEVMLKATLIGNLGSDPDMRYSANGSPLLRFNVASNFRTRTPDGEYQDKTEWVRVTVTGNRAESLSPYLKKGSRVYVEGRLEARPWTDQQGQIRAGLGVLANEVQFMSPRQVGDDQILHTSPVEQRQRPVAAGRGADDGGDLADLPF
jgi:single stranded DNA-binding protein